MDYHSYIPTMAKQAHTYQDHHMTVSVIQDLQCKLVVSTRCTHYYLTHRQLLPFPHSLWGRTCSHGMLHQIKRTGD